MTPQQTTNTVPVPAAAWVAVVDAYTQQLGASPRFLPSSATNAEAATDAIWGDEASGLHLVKTEGGSLVPGGEEVVLAFTNERLLEESFKRIRATGKLKVRDNLRKINEFTFIKGEQNKQQITLATFYVPESGNELADADTFGFIHNPNYPDVRMKKRKKHSYYEHEGRGAYAEAAPYALAALLGAGVAALVFLRRRK